MPPKRFLSLWFPRLAAERFMRLDRGLPLGPLAVVADQQGAQIIASLNAEAEAAGLMRGQPLRDAQAICAALHIRPLNPLTEAAFLATLRRWAGKFTPWVADEPPDGLILDITGCAHLFGGEEGLAREVERDCEGLGLSVRLGLADTVGAAWALARFAGVAETRANAGDAIDQEARATRSRAAKRRHWTRGGAAPQLLSSQPPSPDAAPLRIARPGETRAAIAQLPIAALRLDGATVEGLARLGLRRIDEVLAAPRAGLSRRFGLALIRRLDQAIGATPEPVSPARVRIRFALRMGLPDPIGLEDDLMAALDRLLPELATRLTRAGYGARRVRAEFSRSDGTMQAIEIGLARASAEPDLIRPLLAMKIADIDPGHGIDLVRLVVPVFEPVSPEQHHGHLAAAAEAEARQKGGPAREIEDLMGRLGTRLGLDALTRLHPGDSHIPEKADITVAAAFVPASADWKPYYLERPLRLWPPEPVMLPTDPRLPERFRWHGQEHGVLEARGPERIAPEWWLDEPAWRSGTRDYWRVTTDLGARLWLFYAHGGTMSPGWFCHGRFA